MATKLLVVIKVPPPIMYPPIIEKMPGGKKMDLPP